MELEELRTRLLSERNTADNVIGGEDALRKEYAGVLDAERAIFQQVRNQVTGDGSNVLRRADVVRKELRRPHKLPG